MCWCVHFVNVLYFSRFFFVLSAALSDRRNRRAIDGPTTSIPEKKRMRRTKGDEKHRGEVKTESSKERESCRKRESDLIE